MDVDWDLNDNSITNYFQVKNENYKDWCKRYNFVMFNNCRHLTDLQDFLKTQNAKFVDDLLFIDELIKHHCIINDRFQNAYIDNVSSNFYSHAHFRWNKVEQKMDILKLLLENRDIFWFDETDRKIYIHNALLFARHNYDRTAASYKLIKFLEFLKSSIK